jgi:hypothetical protein
MVANTRQDANSRLSECLPDARRYYPSGSKHNLSAVPRRTRGSLHQAINIFNDVLWRGLNNGYAGFFIMAHNLTATWQSGDRLLDARFDSPAAAELFFILDIQCNAVKKAACCFGNRRGQPLIRIPSTSLGLTFGPRI